MPLTFAEVSEILKIIDASNCQEVVLELGDTKLVVRRNGAAPEAGAATTPARQAGGPAPAASAPAPEAAPSPTAAAAPADEAGKTAVRAPMTGTFYSRPSPEEEPFVTEGARVAAGDPVCIIEVMKLFTTIEAPCAGTVEWIAAEDGALVEFDQLLLVIRPD